MATNKQQGRSRALRPSAEALEGRQLLAGSISGMNTAGDHWTLTVLGKGKVQVIKQNDATTGLPAALDSATEINSIILSGTDPTSTRLVEKVTPASGSSGKIYFQNLTEQPNHSDRTGGNLGILSVNIPDFYLANTEAARSATTTDPAASITIPDGINSLRFGGADTTVSFATSSTTALSSNGISDQFLIRIGAPFQNGVDIITNSITSNGQAAVASATGQTPSPTQDSVVFQVGGRLNMFQANSISGNTDVPITSAGFSGGTIVSSLTDPVTGLIGQIGFIRVGGNATNFSVLTNSQIANFYVGGETNTVAVLAPVSIRNVFFGRGMDTTTILTNQIESIAANRGALNSRVVVDRNLGNSTFGGDVVNSTFLAGYLQGLAGVVSSVQNTISQTGQYFQQDVSLPTPTAQAGGTLTTNVAGDITNSVFAASDNPISQVIDPTTQIFGNANDALLPVGRITARVEGSIDNSTATPEAPNTAFFARQVKFKRGAVAPPNVTEPPLPKPATPISLRGIPRVFPKVNGSLQVRPAGPQI